MCGLVYDTHHYRLLTGWGTKSLVLKVLRFSMALEAEKQHRQFGPCWS
jgi:hypothetical protein